MPTALILGYDRGCPCEYFCLLGIDRIFKIEVLNHNELCSFEPFCHLAEASAYFFFQDLSFLNPIESVASQVQNCSPIVKRNIEFSSSNSF